MEIKKIGNIAKGQDGAVYNGYLFRFDASGTCRVYRLDHMTDDQTPFSQFVLDKAHLIAPHSNSVAFGRARYNETDEFPLLYSNVYNNYAKSDNPLKGVTCVYRLARNGDTFSSALVQLIEIGFTNDPLWRSENLADVRPYGNFAIDSKRNRYYAFTMRDEETRTRYFAFPLPAIDEGTYDPVFGVKRFILKKQDISYYFDCEYQCYMQGACLHDGILYSLEGFSRDTANPPAIRLIDVENQKQENVYSFSDYEMPIEPELIDFENRTCYYADHDGNLYTLTF